MPAKTPEERTALSRLGAAIRWHRDDPEMERAARTRFNAARARAHLLEAAEVAAAAEAALRGLGDEEPVG